MWNNYTESGGIRDSCALLYGCWEDGGQDQMADSFDLTPYAGQTIDIRFRFRSGLEGTAGPEGSLDYSGLDGFAIDNISVRTRDVNFGASTFESQQLENLDLLAGESLQVQLTADFVDNTLTTSRPFFLTSTWDRGRQTKIAPMTRLGSS